MKVFVTIAFFLFSLNCFSQVITVSDAEKLVNLAEGSYYLEDATKNLSIQDVRNRESEFQKVDKPFINFGVSSSAYWVKCTIRNETTKELLIEIGNPTLLDILLYEFDSTGMLTEYHSGSWLPVSQRHTNDINYQFELKAVQDKDITVYLRVMNSNGTQFRYYAGTSTAFSVKSNNRNFLEGTFYGFMLVMLLYNLFLYFSLKDESYLFYVLYIFFMAGWNAIFQGYAANYIWPSTTWLSNYAEVVACFVGMSSLLFAINFLQTKKNTPSLHKMIRLMFALYIGVLLILLAGKFIIGTIVLEIVSLISIMLLFITAIIIFRRGYKPSGFFLIAWSFLMVSIVIYILKDYNVFPYNTFTRHSIQIGSAIEALLLSIALANRINILKTEKEAAQLEMLASLEENKKLITEQNIVLEKKVEERTGELEKVNDDLVKVIHNLEETQTQLVQREKMASLGELTAGIAHEIQNPLNFVNNFSEVNEDLLRELNNEAEKGNLAEVKEIAKDLASNSEKINHHGKRAEAIVKGMLQHSRTSSGQKELTDINKLCDEYLRLAYHGLRAKDKSFNAKFETEFDPAVDKVNIIAQELGRVILNLINNAFYTVSERQNAERLSAGQEGLKEGTNAYEPTVTVSTKKIDFSQGTGGVEIRVKDNGNGIPETIQKKIFQPFFTTKPAGQGTGLGLSLSYEIITKGHNGKLMMETKEGEGSEFIIQLPTV